MCNDDPDVFPVSGGPCGVVLSLALLCPGLGGVECSNSCVGLAQWELMAGGMGCVGVMLPRGFGESWCPGYTSMQPGAAA